MLFDAGNGAAEQRLLLEELGALGATYEGTGGPGQRRARRQNGVDALPLSPIDEALRRAERRGTLRYQHGGDARFLTLLDDAVRTQNWTARHEEPLVPHDAAKLVIADCTEHPLLGEIRLEWLWARPCRDGRYEILSAAFVAYELYIGDIVRVEQRGHRLPRVVGVDERSGRRLLRVQTPEDIPEQGTVLAEAEGARVERSSRWPDYVAVDVEDDDHANRVRSWLDAQEQAGALVYETAWP